MRVGIIGIGEIAQVHIAALLKNGQDIVALCDVATEKCQKASEKFRLRVATYTDYREMIRKERPDVVHVCTPHALHAEEVCFALDNNVNVLCEKPLAVSLAQVKEIEEAAARSSARVGVCQQNRFKASVRYVKAFFADKEILSAVGTLCWQRDKTYYENSPWRGQKALAGGGVATNQALHTLDLLQWFCGMPRSVVGHTATDLLSDVIDVEETAFGIFTLKNGGRFVLNATNAASASFPVTIMLRSREDEVVLVNDNVIVNGKFVAKSDGLPLFGKEVWGVGHVTLIRKFYDALSSGEKFELEPEEAKKVVLLLSALYRSDGKEIEIQEDIK